MKYFIVNAFTYRLFAGNPAAVCIVNKFLSDEEMQLIAKEFNLPETAFIEKKNGTIGLRWFTPKMEVDLCGHATLASAHVLWEQNIVDTESIVLFETRSGRLSVERKDNLIVMNFPREDAIKTECPYELKKALKTEPIYTGKNRFDYIAEVSSEEIVRNMVPDFRILEGLDSRGVIVISVSDTNEYDFVSRFFAPNAGIPEDPVTGSAHCCLAPYWSAKLNKIKLTGYQASDRGGK